MQNLATCLLALERGGRGVLLMTFHLMVEFVSARNYHEIDSFNITMLLCEMLTLAWKNFNLDTSSKFISKQWASNIILENRNLRFR